MGKGYDALRAAEGRGQVVQVGQCYMIEITRSTAVDAIREGVAARGGWIVSESSELRDTGGQRAQTVYTIIAVW